MKIIKRNGQIVDFNSDKIFNAILKASLETDLGADYDLIREITDNVEIELESVDFIPSVEFIQDLVEDNLMQSDRRDIAKRYILYREEKSKLRKQGWEMTDLQRDIYEKKYRFENETFDEFLDRVSGGNGPIKKAIRDKKFLPAGRILAGRGTDKFGRKITLSNCFVKGTQILTNEGMKNIEDIEIGDMVYTHTNRLQPVVNTLKRTYTGKLYSIKTHLNLEKTYVTAEHPYYTQRGWVKVENLSTNDYIKLVKTKDGIDPTAKKKMKEGGYILIGDELYVKITNISHIDLESIGGQISVYNISVENDNSYSANGLVCHNCYVMPKVEDNIESIFDTAKYLARTYSYGGGCGVSISKLRPKGAKVNNAANTTTGAVSFMDLFSLVTGLIGMKGRRGALMLNLDCDHPDIEDFINVKKDLSKVTSANISINMTDDFMDAVINDEEYELYFKVKDTGEEITKTVKARELFRKIAINNWDNGEPGVLFEDRINSWHLMSEDEDFEFAGVNP